MLMAGTNWFGNAFKELTTFFGPPFRRKRSWHETVRLYCRRDLADRGICSLFV